MVFRGLGTSSLLCAALASTLISTVATAQSPPAATRDTTRRDSARVILPAVEVRASIVPTAGAAVGSGVPGQVTRISKEEIVASSPRVLPDALASQPGISSFDDLGTPWKLSMSMRGFGTGPTVGSPAGMTVFLDGVRQNEADAQEVNFDLLPIDNVSRVEVLRGTASLLGPNSLGGAINLITPRGGGPASGEVEVQGGAFGQAAVQTSVSGAAGAGGKYDYYISGGARRERGWRDATDANGYNLLANFGSTSQETGFGIQAFAARSRAETAGSLPETMFDANPRANFTAGDFDDLNMQQVAVHGLSPALSGSAGMTLYLRRSVGERFNVNQVPDPNVRSRTNAVTVGGTADWRRPFLEKNNLNVRLGADAALNHVRARIYNEPSVETNVDAAERELTTDVRSPSVDLATYALADYRIGRVTLSGGGRFDYIRVPFTNAVDARDNTTSTYRALSPRAGASVALGDGASMYASAGAAFRAPAILELGCADPDASCPLPFALGDDPPLDPVHATTYEIGGQLARGSIVASVAVYRSNVHNEIFFVASEGALLSGYFTNLDRTRREGVELSVDGVVGDRVRWYANYAATRAVFLSAADLFSVRSDEQFAGSMYAGGNHVDVGDRLPLVPDQLVSAGFSASLSRRFSVGIDVRGVGHQWLRGDEANATSPLAAYGVVNGRVAYSARGWTVSGVITNLLDSHAASFGAFNENRLTQRLERFLTPLNGRGFEISLRRAVGRDAPRDR
jgi:outer membrane receptor protein involved in Fe transport